MDGGLAQLGERKLCKLEVTGSSPVSSRLGGAILSVESCFAVFIYLLLDGPVAQFG